MLAKRSLLTAIVLTGALACTTDTALAASWNTTTGSPQAAPMVSHFDDGSFEYPVTPYPFTNYTTGKSIGPWRVTKGSVETINGGYWQPAEGTQSIDLNGEDVGAVSQTFTTTPGRTYTVTYSLAGNPVGGHVKTGRVLVDGQDVQNFSFDTTGKSFTNMGWIKRQVTFVATDTTTTLTFDSTTTQDPPYGPAIDDVQVTPNSCGCSR
jgi:choice-of-anchor C domain-containing protein